MVSAFLLGILDSQRKRNISTSTTVKNRVCPNMRISTQLKSAERDLIGACVHRRLGGRTIGESYAAQPQRPPARSAACALQGPINPKGCPNPQPPASKSR